MKASVVRAADGTYRLEWKTHRPGTAYVHAAADSHDPSRTGALVATTNAGHARVTGLDPARRWFFEIASRPSKQARGTIAGARHIDLAGADEEGAAGAPEQCRAPAPASRGRGG